ncbi:DUF3108 domain-containing protein [Ottowia caeni]|uniref:DUF3108 domain-containing protein n=1 Tax=Ottowia caeni TaxID=2870339 RepID=UPI003D762B8A
MICTAVVMAFHALLIVGLPRWGSIGNPGLGNATFITRMIAPVVSEPPAEEPQTPAPPTPAESAQPPEPTVAPQPDKPTPETPKPVPPKAQKTPQNQPVTNEVTPPASGGMGQAGAGSDREPSILAMPPPPQFGPFPGVTPIALRPTDAEAQSVRPSIKSAGDAPTLMPHPANITFMTTGTVAGIPVVVPSTLVWRHDGNFYEANWVFYHVKAGEQSHYSNGLVTPQGLAPLASSYRTKVRQEMRFDHAGERLEFTPELAEWKMPPGTQDRLSLIIQLAALFAADPDRYPPGSTISLPVATAAPPSVQTWSFVVGPEKQNIEGLRGTQLQTVYLVHEPAQDTDTRMELWLAPALEYLPARVRIAQPNGDNFDFTADRAFGTQVQRSLPQ